MFLRTQAQILHTLNPLRALQSLREEHVVELSRVIAHEGGRWQLERHEGYDGDLTAVLTLAAQMDEKSLSLAVHRTQAGFHLAACRGDNYEKLGCSISLGELTTQLREAMSRAGGDAGPGSPSDQTPASPWSSRASNG